ncbi:MAG: UDP-N-acetylmuramoyl-L-alanine--D-glutamate ligase [Bacteroidales bacterium]|nr:UDP-N-acetylmuramoyl-L-alanine--D-glutamate ligase [Bacteroidales bacterium]
MKYSLDRDLWQNKSILILGFGREGRAAYNFLKSQLPECEFGISDISESIDIQSKSNLNLHLGSDYLSVLSDYDIIIKSPGVQLPDLSAKEMSKIVTPTEIFLCLFSEQTIGITGTKGKSTTATLIHHFLISTGKKAILLGNMGLPALNYVDQIEEDTLIVFELSAHQLEYVHHSPHISLLLNIFPEHLDYFKTFADYRNAKYNIFAYQKPGDTAICAQKGLSCPKGEVLENPDTELQQMTGGKYTLESIEQLTQLKGQHNFSNIVAALKVVERMRIPVEEAIKTLPGFAPLPHRLEFVGEFGGVRFYNDSISTVPQSTIEAIKTLNDVNALILGGYDRGLDYSELTNFLVESHIEYFYFLGKAGQRMFEILNKKEHQQYFKVRDLEDVFARIRNEKNIKGCLLSPAASSYDQFKNFEHRGDHFKALARRFERA